MEHDGAGWLAHGVLALVLLGLLTALWRSGFIARVMRLIEQTLLGNWQLAILGAAAIALSLASWYTTFDGLRNFTSAPLLSALVAFGVQGVMLIVSWLIGESFATGMRQRGAAAGGSAMSAREKAVAVALATTVVVAAFCWALGRSGAVGLAGSAGGMPRLRADWARVAEVSLYFLMAVAVLGLIVLAVRRGSETLGSYVQGMRLIARNAVLWVMLLACMTATVLFSLDSHFTAIFPAEQRRRAAEIRTVNQIGAVVADIGARARAVQAGAAARLLETESWQTADAGLAALAAAARGARAEIEAVLDARLEAQQRSIGEQQERIAGAERSQSALLRRRDELEAELRRLEASIGAQEAELANAQAAHDATRQAIAAKEIEAAAESGGVEGSLRPGKGPLWRQRTAEAGELRRRLKLADEPRLAEAQRRRDAASARIVGLRRELATIVAEAARYTGAIRAAEHRIEAVEAGGGQGGRSSTAHLVEGLERARAAFRRHPDAASLAALQAQCTGLQRALSGVAAAWEEARRIDCDLKATAEAAARVLALNAGLASFEAGCAGGSRLPQLAGTDALLAFGRKCLQDSGLVSADTADFAARFQAIEMNRDDKAHRFVVTWNALLDGNRLAYLALAIAIGIDALVFMAGLFGAAAARSPLTDVPSPRLRSAEQLEAIVRSALAPDPADNAALVLAALRPASGDADERSEIDLAGCDAAVSERIRKVLVAGRSIGAVERADAAADRERYLVRPELVAFLATVASTAGDAQRAHARRARLVELLGAALEPDQSTNAAIVLRHAEPIEPTRGFVARLDLAAVAREKDRRMVQGVLGAGISSGVVRRQGAPGWLSVQRWPASAAATYMLGADLFEALLHYRAIAPAPRPVRASPGPVRLTAVDVEPEPADDTGLAIADAAPLPVSRRLGAADNAAALPRLGDEQGLHHRYARELAEEVALQVRAAIAGLCRRSETRGTAQGDLERLARDAVQALQRTTRAVARGQAADAHALAVLGQASDEVRGRIPGLLLELLEDLIGEAERSGDDDLLSRLRRLRDGVALLDGG